jgi:hypothetical protein
VRQPHDTSTIGAEAGVGREIATPMIRHPFGHFGDWTSCAGDGLVGGPVGGPVGAIASQANAVAPRSWR